MFDIQLLCGYLRLVFSRDLFLFFFKQKTAYEMRISDWSSDVCSSDLPLARAGRDVIDHEIGGRRRAAEIEQPDAEFTQPLVHRLEFVEAFEIGRASCRERVCQYV